MLPIIMASAASILSGPGKPPELQIYRSGLAPSDVTKTPYLVVKAAKAKAEAKGTRPGSAVERRVQVVCVIYAKRDQETPVEETLAPFVEWATDAIGGNRTLGGMVISCDETDTEWDAQPGNPELCAAVVIFSAHYLTKRNNQETA